MISSSVLNLQKKKKKDKIFIPGFVTFRKVRIGSKGGGILFLINKRQGFYEL